MTGGRVFEAAEIRSGKPACVIGETVREKLLGSADSIGEKIRVQTMS